MGERRDAYRVLAGKREGKRPHVRPRHRWEDNIKMNLQDVGWGAWTVLKQSLYFILTFFITCNI